MPQRKKQKTPQQEKSPERSPEKGAGSPAKSTKNLSPEEAQKLIDDLKAQLNATSGKKRKGPNQSRSAMGAADSDTDDDEDVEEVEKTGQRAAGSSPSSSKSKSGSFSKLGNRAQKARKLFKDKDEEAEFQLWKASKLKPLAATPIGPLVPAISDEALARSRFFFLSDCFSEFFLFPVDTISRKLHA